MKTASLAIVVCVTVVSAAYADNCGNGELQESYVPCGLTLGRIPTVEKTAVERTKVQPPEDKVRGGDLEPSTAWDPDPMNFGYRARVETVDGAHVVEEHLFWATEYNPKLVTPQAPRDFDKSKSGRQYDPSKDGIYDKLSPVIELRERRAVTYFDEPKRNPDGTVWNPSAGIQTQFKTSSGEMLRLKQDVETKFYYYATLMQGVKSGAKITTYDRPEKNDSDKSNFFAPDGTNKDPIQLDPSGIDDPVYMV